MQTFPCRSTLMIFVVQALNVKLESLEEGHKPSFLLYCLPAVYGYRKI